MASRTSAQAKHGRMAEEKRMRASSPAPRSGGFGHRRSGRILQTPTIRESESHPTLAENSLHEPWAWLLKSPRSRALIYIKALPARGS